MGMGMMIRRKIVRGDSNIWQKGRLGTCGRIRRRSCWWNKIRSIQVVCLLIMVIILYKGIASKRITLAILYLKRNKPHHHQIKYNANPHVAQPHPSPHNGPTHNRKKSPSTQTKCKSNNHSTKIIKQNDKGYWKSHLKRNLISSNKRCMYMMINKIVVRGRRRRRMMREGQRITLMEHIIWLRIMLIKR